MPHERKTGLDAARSLFRLCSWIYEYAIVHDCMYDSFHDNEATVRCGAQRDVSRESHKQYRCIVDLENVITAKEEAQSVLFLIYGFVSDTLDLFL